MKRNVLIILLLIAGINICHSQTATNQDALEVLKKVTINYQQAPYLSFDAAYYYADEKSPGNYLDSLKGSFKINGVRCWYLFDSTESLYSDDYVVVLYREDKVMYLSKPTHAAAVANPLAMLDSLLNKKDIVCHLVHTNGAAEIIIDFSGISQYKQMKYVIDENTGYISKMVSLVKSEQLYDASIRSQLTDISQWSVIEVRFDHYRQKSFDDSLLDTGRYFKKQGKEYVTVPPYQTYKIFLGTQNL